MDHTSLQFSQRRIHITARSRDFAIYRERQADPVRTFAVARNYENLEHSRHTSAPHVPLLRL